ncbi:MAG TPA: SdiA-regulated domain-containing protein [Rhodothermales bacterium]|nr:SdiA-regulated domain-containing protein [Rhodothermales bacterium]
MTHTISLCIPILLSLLGCGSQNQREPSSRDPVYEFDFANPAAEFVLPGRLTEISGLTLVDDSLVAAVQDEKGEVFIINFLTGDVVDEFKFAKDGDFEGIELVDDTMYVLRSDGAIFVITDWRSDDRDAVKIDTPLSRRNDAEGLGYQPDRHRLLVAAKEYPGDGLSRIRSIFSFDLRTKTMDPEPVYTISLDTIGVRLGLPGESLRKLLWTIVDLEAFKPSALAVHPLTEDIFVISSVLKVIAVVTPSGNLTDLLPVEVDRLRQPEGLAFLPNGDLLVSTEGRGDKGRIFRFNQTRIPE